jgi:hypothetical protein
MSLPNHVREQIARLTPAQKRRLAAIVRDCIQSVEAIQEIRLDSSHFADWPVAERHCRDAQLQLSAIISLPVEMETLLQAGPNPGSAGLAPFPDHWPAWQAIVNERASAALEYLGLVGGALAPVRRKRRSSAPRLTDKEKQAYEMVAERGGNVTAAARGTTATRQAMDKKYKKALVKLGEKPAKTKKPRAKRLPLDQRGQVVVASKTPPIP